MTYEELIEQTMKFQAEALGICEAIGFEHEIQIAQRASDLADGLGDFAEAQAHCRIAAAGR